MNLFIFLRYIATKEEILYSLLFLFEFSWKLFKKCKSTTMTIVVKKKTKIISIKTTSRLKYLLKETSPLQLSNQWHLNYKRNQLRLWESIVIFRIFNSCKSKGIPWNACFSKWMAIMLNCRFRKTQLLFMANSRIIK